jgi:hypothetical protein
MSGALLASIILSLQYQVVASLYQYTDDQGTQHVVTDAETIPPRYQKGVQILDDEGQVLGILRREAVAGHDDSSQLEALKRRGRGREKNNQNGRSAALIEAESADSDLSTGSRPAPGKAPEGSPAWAFLAIALVIGVMALRMLTGILRIAAFACALLSMLVFIGEQFGDTPVGAKVKGMTETLVKPLKRVKEAAGEKLAKPLKAPFEVIDKVKGAIDQHEQAAEERNAILEKLSEGD